MYLQGSYIMGVHMVTHIWLPIYGYPYMVTHIWEIIYGTYRVGYEIDRITVVPHVSDTVGPSTQLDYPTSISFLGLLTVS